MPFRLLVALLWITATAAAGEFTGKVVAVHDGDTISVLTPAKRPIRVRLHGIDAPELKQAFGARAKQALSKQLSGARVRLTTKETDRYGRPLASVYLGAEWVNETQVKAGLAWVYVRYTDDPRLLAAEASARSAKRGLWSEKSPVPPWEWRHAKQPWTPRRQPR